MNPTTNIKTTNRKMMRRNDSEAPAVSQEYSADAGQQKLSDDERALIARLIRVVRHKTYWLGAYIEWLLQIDAAARIEEGIGTAAAKTMLEKIEGLDSWRNWFRNQPQSDIAPILRYYGHRYFPDDVDRAQFNNLASDSETQFYELERMWREEHLTPAARRLDPPGCLGKGERD